jgi:hypothetical protein
MIVVQYCVKKAQIVVISWRRGRPSTKIKQELLWKGSDCSNFCHKTCEKGSDCSNFLLFSSQKCVIFPRKGSDCPHFSWRKGTYCCKFSPKRGSFRPQSGAYLCQFVSFRAHICVKSGAKESWNLCIFVSFLVQRNLRSVQRNVLIWEEKCYFTSNLQTNIKEKC